MTLLITSVASVRPKVPSCASNHELLEEQDSVAIRTTTYPRVVQKIRERDEYQAIGRLLISEQSACLLCTGQ